MRNDAERSARVGVVVGGPLVKRFLIVSAVVGAIGACSYRTDDPITAFHDTFGIDPPDGVEARNGHYRSTRAFIAEGELLLYLAGPKALAFLEQSCPDLSQSQESPVEARDLATARQKVSWFAPGPIESYRLSYSQACNFHVFTSQADGAIYVHRTSL